MRVFQRPVLNVFMPVIVLSFWLTSCKQEKTEQAGNQPAESEQAKPVDLLVFPDDIRVADESVNTFVERAMRDCAGGDYEKFRLLWSAREDPLSRQEYDEGWQAVQKIEVLRLEKVIIAPSDDRPVNESDEAYAVLADVDFDPTHRAARDNPHRDVVLMMIREHGDWRLARAPKGVELWIKG